MDRSDSRFSLPADKYLDKHHVLTYIEDAISQLLEHKEENPKVNPSRFFSEYFTSVREGNHVLFREFSYIRATFHNRASFVRTFWKCFRHIGRKGDLLSMKEYHSLICLLCADFPFQPIQKTARIILMDDAMDCLISFSDFLFAFQLQFCFDEFLVKCAEMYKTLLSVARTPHDPVVVPTSEESPAENFQPVSDSYNTDAGNSGQDGVDSAHFLRALTPVTEKMEPGAPPVSVLREILSSVQRVTFYGFLIALAKSESLNQSVGKLPDKAHLLDISDQELSSPPIRPSSAAKVRPSSGKTSHHLPGAPGVAVPPTQTITNTMATTTKPTKPRVPSSTPAALLAAKNNRKVFKPKVASSKTVVTSSDDSDDGGSGSGSSTN